MNQSFDTQLQVMKRALTDVVMPELGGAASHVVEQLHLSLTIVEFMQARLPHARRYYRSELRAYAVLTGAIVTLLSKSGADMVGALLGLESNSKALLNDPEAEWEDYISLTRHIRASIARLAENASGQSYEAALDNLILIAAEDMQVQARIWCVPFGFELRAEDFPAAEWMGRG